MEIVGIILILLLLWLIMSIGCIGGIPVVIIPSTENYVQKSGTRF